MLYCLQVVPIRLLIKNVMETTFANVRVATKYASMAISFAASSLNLDANAMSRVVAICEEFCEKVSCLYKHKLLNGIANPIEGEIKCSLDAQYFTELTLRLVQIRYCCTQVQRDKENKKCIAWFEPMSPE